MYKCIHLCNRRDTVCLAERDLDSDVIIERFSTPLLMHWNTWIAVRSIEDGSRLYINEGIKMLLLIEALSDWTKDVALLSYCPADMPQDLLLFMMLAADILFFKATQSICRIPIMENNKCSMSKLLGIFIIVCLAPPGTEKAHAVNLWPWFTGDSWSQLYAFYPCELHSPKDILTWSDDSAMTLRGCLDCLNWKMFKKKKTLQRYWWPQRCCQLLGVTLYRCFCP